MQITLHVLALFLQATLARALQAFVGSEPIDAVSTHFSVDLEQVNHHVRGAMVYVTNSPNDDLNRVHTDAEGHPIFCSLHGGQFCNRSASWVEFGSDPSKGGTAIVTVTSLGGPVFVNGVTAHPLSYNLRPKVLHEGLAVQLELPAGQILQISLEYGEPPSGSFRNALLIFTGGLDPELPLSAPNLLRFPPGMTRVPGNGVLQLPAGVDTILLPRGAWLDGRINITRHQLSPVSVVGHGIISGRRFVYHGGKVEDYLRCIEPQYDRPLYLDGPTFVDPKGHSLFVPPHSTVRNWKMLGWLFNEDGVWITSNSTLEHSFVRTNDDSIRFYAGALDGFPTGTGMPAPPKGVPAWNIQVRDVVVSQMFNGGVIQIGWEDAGVTDSSITGLDVVRAEWYKEAGLSPNNAVLSLRGPVYDVAMQEHHRNISLEHVRIDGVVGRILGLGLFGTNRSTVQGLHLRNVTARKPLQWWPVSSTDMEPGDNFIVAEVPDSIEAVTFEGVEIGGNIIQSNSDWNMNVSGEVTGVAYFAT